MRYGEIVLVLMGMIYDLYCMMALDLDMDGRRA